MFGSKPVPWSVHLAFFVASSKLNFITKFSNYNKNMEESNFTEKRLNFALKALKKSDKTPKPPFRKPHKLFL